MNLSIMLKEEEDSFRINQYILKESFDKIEVWERYYTKNRKIGDFDTVKYGDTYIAMFSHNELTSVDFYTEDDKKELASIEIFNIENKYPCEAGCKIEAQLEPLSFIQCSGKTLAPTQIDNRIRIFAYKTLITECKYVKFGNFYISCFYCFNREEDMWELSFYMDSHYIPEHYVPEKEIYIIEQKEELHG